MKCSFMGEKLPRFENEVSNEIMMIKMSHGKTITKKSVPSNNPKRIKEQNYPLTSMNNSHASLPMSFIV